MFVANKKTWKNFHEQKDTTVRARMDAATIDMLNKCCEALKTTRSDVIRTGIKHVYDDISKEK